MLRAAAVIAAALAVLSVLVAVRPQQLETIHRVGGLWLGPREEAQPFIRTLDQSVRQLD